MITYKNYTLPYKADDILEHIITGSKATAEEWLADVELYEKQALPDVEEEVQERLEERVQNDMNNYLALVDENGEE